MAKIIQIVVKGNQLLGLDNTGKVWTLVDQPGSIFWTPTIDSPKLKAKETQL